GVGRVDGEIEVGEPGGSGIRPRGGHRDVIVAGRAEHGDGAACGANVEDFRAGVRHGGEDTLGDGLAGNVDRHRTARAREVKGVGQAVASLDVNPAGEGVVARDIKDVLAVEAE